MTNQDKNCLTGKVKGGCNYRSTLSNTKFQYMEFHYLLNLLVNNNAHSVLSNIIHPSSLAMVTLVGHAFLNSTHTLWRSKKKRKKKGGGVALRIIFSEVILSIYFKLFEIQLKTFSFYPKVGILRLKTTKFCYVSSGCFQCRWNNWSLCLQREQAITRDIHHQAPVRQKCQFWTVHSPRVKEQTSK